MCAMACLTVCYVAYLCRVEEPTDGVVLGTLGALFGAYAGIALKERILDGRDR